METNPPEDVGFSSKINNRLRKIHKARGFPSYKPALKSTPKNRATKTGRKWEVPKSL